MPYTAIIIEDEPWSLIDIQKSFPFESYNFEVIASFQDSVAALDSIIELNPDLIVTDINMPNLTGIDLMKKIRQQNIDSEIVVISGYNEFAYAQQAIKYGVLAYCLKPTNSQEARDAMEKAKKRLDEKKGLANSEQMSQESESHDSSCFEKLVNYIDNHFYEKLTLHDLAHKYNFNPNYCCYLFSKHKNTTFSQYVTNLRIDKAKQLIETTDFTLEKIADVVGFHDYFYFSKVFKKSCGISPKEYKKKRGI